MCNKLLSNEYWSALEARDSPGNRADRPEFGVLSSLSQQAVSLSKRSFTPNNESSTIL